MGRKSKGRNSNSSSLSTNTSSSNISVREMMRGLKNRWGRFQCPRDGSICKSLEAWHWHRHKYHQTEHINYVELDPDVADSNAPGGATPQSTTTAPLLSPSSPRLLPPEAFAPRRPPEMHFPDDASDLTEPDAPVLLLLLSEEVTSREEAPTGSGEPAEEVQWEVMDESTSVADDDDDEQIAGSRQVTMTTTTTDSRSLEPEAAAARLHGDDAHGNQESKTAVVAREFRATQSPARETSVHRHGNGVHGYQRERCFRPRSHERSLEHAVQPPHCPAASSGPASSCHASSGPTASASSCPATSGPASSDPTTSASLSSAMDLVAVYVLRVLERDRSPRPTAHDILREVDAHFPGLGLSRDGLEGVVAGALMGARDQWTNGYNAGWKDGAKEVLNAPLLRSVTPSPLHSPDGVAATWNTGQVTLLTPGRRSKDEREDHTLAAAEKVVELSRDSIETVETSADQSRDSSTHHHGNDPNNNNDASS